MPLEERWNLSRISDLKEALLSANDDYDEVAEIDRQLEAHEAIDNAARSALIEVAEYAKKSCELQGPVHGPLFVDYISGPAHNDVELMIEMDYTMALPGSFVTGCREDSKLLQRLIDEKMILPLTFHTIPFWLDDIGFQPEPLESVPAAGSVVFVQDRCAPIAEPVQDAPTTFEDLLVSARCSTKSRNRIVTAVMLGEDVHKDYVFIARPKTLADTPAFAEQMEQYVAAFTSKTLVQSSVTLIHLHKKHLLNV